MGDLVPVKAVGHVGTIEDNLDAVEASIREKVKEYNAVVITEDTIADGQKFRASINKEKKNLDDERKAIKQEWMKPYNDFEKRAKEIIALYDEPIQIIDKQLEDFEEQRKEMKRQQIKLAYDAVKGDLADWLPLEKIYNPKWENKTYSTKALREDMEKDFAQIQMYIDTVKSTESEFVDDGLKVLKETGDLQTALTTIHNLQTMKERVNEIEEQKAAEAEKKATETEQNAEDQIEDQQDPNAVFSAQSAQAFDLEPFQVEGERIYAVTVNVPESRIGALRELLDAAGYEYEVS